MVSMIKKMLSKFCMFGLAATMSFGLGSFLARAQVPLYSDEGTLAEENIINAVIGMNPNDTLRVAAVVGTINNYDGSDKQLIRTSDGDGLSIFWHNNGEDKFVNSADHTNLAGNHSTVTANFGSIYLRAVNRQNNSTKTDWSKIWENGSLIPTGITAIRASSIGQYDFYYYIDSSLFNSSGTAIS